LPACDIGWPYFARFAGVSGIGPLVVRVVVIDAPDDGSTVVTELETAAPVGAAGAAVSEVADGLGAVVVVVVVVVGCWA
jgi:hypothetical protein